jgi:hypothetical protein
MIKLLGKFAKSFKGNKGQGLTEYVLILAFIAGIAIVMFGGGGLKETLAATITNTNDTLAAVFGGKKSYSYYFNKWRTAPLDTLSAESNATRIEADQEGLAIIARAIIECGTATKVADFMNTHAGNVTSGFAVTQYTDGSAAKGDDGYSDVMIALSYRSIPLDDQKDFFWIDSNKNQETLKMMADDIKVYDKTNNDANTYGKDYKLNGANEPRTRSTDRFFYSTDMINNNASSTDKYYPDNDRSIALRVHYDDNGNVDHVNIAAFKGKNGSGEIAEGLNLTVTKDSITERSGPL